MPPLDRVLHPDGIRWRTLRAVADEPGVRIDRWLCAARLFRTRGLAQEAIEGGRVHVGGVRIKPSREVGVGEVLELTVGGVRRTIVVRGLAERRGPASVARELYEETPDSVARRERQQEARRAAPPVGADLGARPTKRDRRRIDALRRARRRDA
jgi:ribosome-associated heat shock protein Hsp15